MKLTTASKTVAAMGTRERLVAVAANVAVRAVTIVAKEGNSGLVYVGDAAIASNNSPDLAAGDSLTLGPDPSGGRLNLSDIYLDVSVSGEGVDFWAIE